MILWGKGNKKGALDIILIDMEVRVPGSRMGKALLISLLSVRL